MSDYKDLCIQLLDRVPEYKMGYVIEYLQGIIAADIPEDEIYYKLQEAEREAEYTEQRYTSKDILESIRDVIGSGQGV